MKKILVLVFLFTRFCISANGQVNIVPNNSFEYHTQPCTNNSVTTALPWQGPHSNSTDYFNVCGSSGFGIPQNLFGYETAQDSFAYAGFIAYALPNMFIYDAREYAETILLDTLKAGEKYCITFYISLADSSEYAVSNISSYFSPNGGGTAAGAYFNYTPQVNNPVSDIITQKNGWVKISGNFIAVGSERYITIGNFKRDTSTNVTYVGPLTNANWAIAYYYLDNVSVVEIADCNAGASTQICPGDSVQLGIPPFAGVTYSWQPTTGINDINISNPMVAPSITTTYTLTQTQCDDTTTATVTVTIRNDCDIFPPIIIPTILKSDELLMISGLQPESKLEIFDIRGRKVFVSENYHNDFGVYNIAAGTYAVRFTKPDGEVISQKLCIVK